jgi:hypothetical protein
MLRGEVWWVEFDPSKSRVGVLSRQDLVFVEDALLVHLGLPK